MLNLPESCISLPLTRICLGKNLAATAASKASRNLRQIKSLREPRRVTDYSTRFLFLHNVFSYTSYNLYMSCRGREARIEAVRLHSVLALPRETPTRHVFDWTQNSSKVCCRCCREAYLTHDAHADSLNSSQSFSSVSSQTLFQSLSP